MIVPPINIAYISELIYKFIPVTFLPIFFPLFSGDTGHDKLTVVNGKMRKYILY
jgi:hypothetical protein